MTTEQTTQMEWASGLQQKMALIDATHPEEMARTVLKHLTAVAAMGRRHGAGHSRYNTHAELILDLTTGAVVADLTLPEGVPLGEVNMCFANTMALCEQWPQEYLYYEGEAYPERSLVPMPHAWAVRRSDGRVVDPTWCNQPILEHSQRAAYVGIGFDIEFVLARAAETGYCSVIGSDYMVDDRACVFGLTTNDDGIVVAEGNA